MVQDIQSRLAAIVLADVGGYSRLMGVYETGTLAALRARRTELIDGKVTEHGGRIVKTMGDGLLLELPSVVNATQCVIEVQQGMVDRNAGTFLRMILCGLFAFCLLALGGPAGAQGGGVYPGKSWTKAVSPEAVGWSSAGLAAVRAFTEKVGSTAVMIVHRGIVVDAWGEVAVKSNTHSARKSLMSALIGIAVEKGQIRLDMTMAQLGIDDNPPSLSETEKRATVGDLIKSRSGIYHPAFYETPAMTKSKPPRHSHNPGRFWNYNNWDFNALGTIYRQQTGQDIFAALKRQIADPLQMQDFQVSDGDYVIGEKAVAHERHMRNLDPDELKRMLAEGWTFPTGKESIHPAYPMRMTARDLARFGLLYSRGGRWKGRQIVPEAWVIESTKIHTRFDPERGYGYMWWTGRKTFQRVNVREHSYFAAGNRRQLVFVFPYLDLVVVHRVNTDYAATNPLWWQMERLIWLIFKAAGETDLGPDQSIEAAPGTRLDEAALRKALSGSRRNSKNSNGAPVMSIFAEDGTMIAFVGASKERIYHGTWWIENGRYCRRWREWQFGRKGCYSLVKDGEVYRAYDDTGTYNFEITLTPKFSWRKWLMAEMARIFGFK